MHISGGNKSIGEKVKTRKRTSMLSKFSVKRPYTVVVGVVLIIILGVVSFGNMTLDLLPSMNLPYAIVMTT